MSACNAQQLVLSLGILGHVACTPPSTALHKPDATSPADTGCNGDASLCARAYPDVVVPMTHNAFAATAYGFHPYAANQHRTITEQLESGIRGLMLDLHEHDGDIMLCHGDCDLLGGSLGRLPALDGLGEIHAFLEDHPREILTLTLENHIADEPLIGLFQDADLADRALSLSAESTWPTLQEMLDAGQRVVVFDWGGKPVDWILAREDFMTGTDFAFSTLGSSVDEQIERLLSDDACALTRGPEDLATIEFNHFITATSGLEDASAVVNDRDTLVERAERCGARYGRLPNFLAVDYAEYGDVVAAAALLNVRVE